MWEWLEGLGVLSKFGKFVWGKFKNRKKIEKALDLNRSRYFFRPKCLNSNEMKVPVKKQENLAGLKIAFLSHTYNHSSPVARSGAPRRAVTYSNRDKGKEKITKKFYSSYNYRDYISGTIDGAHVEELDFALKKIITQNTAQHIMITGEIGCGKSTLISSTVHKIKMTSETVESIDSVIVNVGELLHERTANVIKDGRSTASEFINQELVNAVVKQSDFLYAKPKDWQSLLEKINQKKSRLVIFFDDIDILYEHVHKQIYLPDNLDVQDFCSAYYQFLYTLIRSLVLDKDYQNDRAIYVFACRQETESMLNDTSEENTHGGESLKDRFGSIIKLEKLTEKNAVLEIIKKRFALANNNNDSPFELPETEEVKNTLFMLHEISPQGLRRAISFLRSAMYFFYYCKNPSSRLFGVTKDIIILSFLDVGRSYSQASCQFINIFLINSNYRKENNTDKKYHPILLTDHFHTYWLKYFLLLHIYIKAPPVTDQAKRNNLSKNDILGIFANTEASIAENNKKYNSNLVLLVLLSLSETEHGRLIRPDVFGFKNGAPNFIGLHCTKRAKYFIEQDVFWSFEYLSVVVDDMWLEFPKDESIKDIVSIFKSPCDYQYLMEIDFDKYNQKNIEIFYTRSKKVLIFLEILKITCELEQKRYPTVYREILKEGVNAPNFNDHIEKIKIKINEFMEKMGNDLTNEQRNQLQELYNYKMSNKDKRKLKKCFSNKYLKKEKNLIDQDPESLKT